MSERSSKTESPSSSLSSSQSPPKSQKPLPKPKRKTKSGCKTCKIRRVKCDEDRPSCHRCVSTGRKCDGYGIWGGGHSNTRQLYDTGGQVSLRLHKPPILKKLATNTESQRLEWFVCRTRTKLPGLFISDFWDKLVLQAICSEPAAFHAALALSSVHRIEEANTHGFVRETRSPTGPEQYTLKQYNKAICELQSRFVSNSASSIRTALIACVMFICMELVRGRYKSAVAHLRSGMELLYERKTCGPGSGEGILNSGSSAVAESETIDDIDDSLTEVLTRLHTQVALFDQRSWGLRISPPSPRCSNLPATFSSMEAARRSLDKILNTVMHLKQKRQRGCHDDLQAEGKFLFSAQKLVQADLASWNRVYKASRVNLVVEKGILGKFAYNLLLPYHAMAEVMADASLRVDDESFYDSHTQKFVSIVDQAAHLAFIVATTDSSGTRFAHGPDIPPFIADLGLNSTLYYTALKCRNHQIRLQAVKLLRSLKSRENIWDSRLAAAIAKEVIAIEEGDFYDKFAVADDFPPLSPPKNRDFSLPSLPDSYRVHDLQISLPQTLYENFEIRCKRKRDDGGWDIITEEIPSWWADEIGNPERSSPHNQHYIAN